METQEEWGRKLTLGGAQRNTTAFCSFPPLGQISLDVFIFLPYYIHLAFTIFMSFFLFTFRGFISVILFRCTMSLSSLLLSSFLMSSLFVSFSSVGLNETKWDRWKRSIMQWTPSRSEGGSLHWEALSAIPLLSVASLHSVRFH